MSAPNAMRNDFADYLKGVLIFLVAYGHLIQFIGYAGQPGYYLDPLFKAIYTFHMPLFMAVSGYVSFQAINRSSWLECSWRRFRQIVVPAICWPLVYLFVKLIIFILIAGTVAGGRQLFRDFMVEYRPGYWFLWAVFGATCLVAISKKLRLDRLEFFGLFTGVMLFAPEAAYLYLFKYTFPFFCLGYALAKGDQIQIQAIRSWPKILALVIIGIGCYLLWSEDTYVYTTRMRLTSANLPNIALRWLAGVVISVLFVVLTFWVYQRVKSPLLSAWGRRSLDIYIIHLFFVEILIACIHPAKDSPWFSWLLAPLLAGILCWLSFWVGDGLGRIPVLRTILLGRTAASTPPLPPAGNS